MAVNNPFKVGGVPEHFNLPWHLAIHDQGFEDAGISVTWHDYPGGTGAMTQALVDGELDVAVALTEGIAARILKGYNLRILQYFVTSPLTWGVFVAKDATFEHSQDLKDRTFAVSRMGSGSHLMAYVYARQHDWQLTADQLQVAGSLEGMANAISRNESDALLWEKFTTKPYVENGQLRLFDETTPPWPAFALVARESLMQYHGEDLRKLQHVINQYNQKLMQDPEAISHITKGYKMSKADAEAWFRQTQWATDGIVSRKDLTAAMDTLYQLNLVDHTVDPSELCSELTNLM